MGGLDSAEEADAFFASFPADPAFAPSVERLKTFLQRVGAAYHNFIDETEVKCRERCMEDLESTTRFVTWSVHSQGSRGIKRFLTEELGGFASPAASAAPVGGSSSGGSGGRGGPSRRRSGRQDSNT